MRIAFAGTPEFAKVQLEALLSTSHEVVVVYTQPDRHSGRGQHLHMSPVKTLAMSHGIPVEQPASLKSSQAEETFASYGVDLMIVVAYGLILPRFYLGCPRLGCVNVHASLLPRWRGASPIQHAILAADEESGITLMKMDEGLDTGDILTQVNCPILPTDTSKDLHDKLAKIGAQLLKNDLASILNRTPILQDPAFVTYAPKISKEQAHCDFQQPAVEIEQRIRAFQPWPILHATLENQLVRIWEAKVVPLSTHAQPGTIVEHTDEGIIVATKDKGLLITKAQLPNKNILAMSEILKSRQTLFAKGNQFQPL